MSDVAEVEGISEATLNWRKQTKLRGRAVPGPKPSNTDQRTAEAATPELAIRCSRQDLAPACQTLAFRVEQYFNNLSASGKYKRHGLQLSKPCLLVHSENYFSLLAIKHKHLANRLPAIFTGN